MPKPKPSVKTNGRTITVRVPISIRKRGGRKLVLAPDGAKLAIAPIHRHIDSMVKALARAFRWRQMLEIGEYATIREIASGKLGVESKRRDLRKVMGDLRTISWKPRKRIFATGLLSSWRRLRSELSNSPRRWQINHSSN
jgi:virulence-associated protein VagC